MTLLKKQDVLTSWSKSASSSCFIYKPVDLAEIGRVLDIARTNHIPLIPHGAGHSYTDAALNSGGIVMDVTCMNRILSWDATRGIMVVQPGVTMRMVVQAAWKDGWWPPVSPSTPDVTIGGCAAMNVNGKNAWKCGPFGETILSLDVLLTTGEVRTLTPGEDPQLFHAFVGSLGLLGIITSITIQLQRVSPGVLTVRRHSASSLEGILASFAAEEPRSDFMEAWIDGFAGGNHLGRGTMSAATLEKGPVGLPAERTAGIDRASRVELPAFVKSAAGLGGRVILPAIRLANSANYWAGRFGYGGSDERQDLFRHTYWSTTALDGYWYAFPEGVETFQAFVPAAVAQEIFAELLNQSHQTSSLPVWCIIKRHRRDPYLLSYQVDGFSLELNYRRTRQNAAGLKPVLEHMIAMVVEAGGRFYLAKDHYLTAAQYRASVGSDHLDAFLRLKQRFDPESLLQSDSFRRVFR